MIGSERAAASSLAAVRSPNALGLLEQLAADASPGVRLRAVEMFGGFDPAAVVGPLVRAMLDDAERRCGPARPQTFAVVRRCRCWWTNWSRASTRRRPSVPRSTCTAMASASAPSMTSGFPDGTSLTDHLIRAAALGQRTSRRPRRRGPHRGVGGNYLADVGALINVFELAHPGNGEALTLTQSRGRRQERARPDPSTATRRPRGVFPEADPRAEREHAVKSWQQAVVRARQAFLARMVMSIVVFGLGVVLVVASSVLFLFGDLDTTAAWGVGGTFVGGLTTMLLITYSGPLKDIRQSMSDLGSATVVLHRLRAPGAADQPHVHRSLPAGPHHLRRARQVQQALARRDPRHDRRVDGYIDDRPER